MSSSDFELARRYRTAIINDRWRYLSGWWSWWQSRNAFCVRELGACPDMGERIDAWQDACSAGWWYPYRDFVVVADRPLAIHQERVGPDGLGSHRMHNADGPAIEWADGWAIWCWHGVVVPEWVIAGPTLELIAAESNTEIRRCAIESLGWDRYLGELGVPPIDEQPDPGNPGQTLRLFRPPAKHQLYAAPVTLLVMHNGSVDRDGHRRTYAETCPGDMTDAVTAAAWQYGRDPETYAALARRT